MTDLSNHIFIKTTQVPKCMMITFSKLHVRISIVHNFDQFLFSYDSFVTQYMNLHTNLNVFSDSVSDKAKVNKIQKSLKLPHYSMEVLRFKI